jgi:hypothetical protein
MKEINQSKLPLHLGELQGKDKKINQSKAIKALIELKKSKWREQHPNNPDFLIPSFKYEDKTANGLTSCIIDYLNLTNGCHAERISIEGRTIDTRKTVTNVVGQVRQIGAIKRIKSSMQLGTADISATILGRSVKIEVKIGNDRQSPDQKEYQRQIENAKGYYLIFKDFQSFYDWFNAKYLKINEKA